MKALYFTDWKQDYVPHILEEIWIKNIYSKFMKKRSVVIDIGANIGLFTQYATYFADKVYSIEPSQRHFDILKKNIEVNEWKQVIPIQCAISNENTKKKFYHTDNATMYSLSNIPARDKNDFEEVDVKTLKTIFDEYKIGHVDFLKIDVEGEEFKIISSNEFTELSKRIDALIVEWHEWANISSAQLVNSLRDRGYTVSLLGTEAKVFEAVKA